MQKHLLRKIFLRLGHKRNSAIPIREPICYTPAKSCREVWLRLITYKQRICYRSCGYLHYVESGQWEANAHGNRFPAVLFICPSERMKLHMRYYATALFAEPLPLYLTAKNTIKSRNNSTIWEKVAG